jgi:cytoskeletal protein CcmA (bactofilin family)
MLTLARRNPVQSTGLKPAHSLRADAPPSFVGSRVNIRGVLEVDGELIVSGLVQGRIAAVRLVIGAGGLVEDDVIAHEVVITGRLIGRVFAPTVTIDETADITGRIFHTNVTAARGHKLEGRMPWRPASYFQTLDQLPEPTI